MVYLEKVWKNLTYQNTINDIIIPIYNKEGNSELNFSFGDKFSAYHAILCGKTGSGKSVLLHQIIINGAIKYPSQELEFVLLDLKDGVEFQYYTDLPHAKVLAIDEDPEFGFQTLLWLDQEYKRRSELFKSAGVKNISEYKNNGSEMSRMIIIIDEFQKMFTYQGIERESATLIENFVRQFRSAGMHLLLSTQTPNSVNWKDTTLEQIAIRMGPAMSKESEEVLFRHGSDLIAANYTEKGKAIYNSQSGIASETQEFSYDYIDAKNYQKLFSAYRETTLKIGWKDQRTIYRKTDSLIVDKHNLTFEYGKENETVEPIIGYNATVARERSVVSLFDERGRASNFLILGNGDDSRQFKSDILNTVTNCFLNNSMKNSNVYFYSESSGKYKIQSEKILNTSKIEDLHSWINTIYESCKNRNDSRILLVIDGIDYLDELSEIDEDNNDNDDWGNSNEELSSKKKMSFILKKGKTRNISVVICSDRRKTLFDVFDSDIFDDFSYALALKGGDNRVNDSDWEYHELEENIGLLNDMKEKKSNKVNLIKIV